ncbi:hypothetical protein HK103_001909 [Boothiomyces macroporosus]|uniref:Uncharacterized protein n=1 Tax=Boothiomyces macroporosus TaxID=261099 RepID=A0AAD5UJH7_9FUNG|nr:hypothetical protein HK103_001909 [Boothiomyces macroporosus]
MQSAEYLETKKIVKDLLTKDGTLALIKAQLARKVVDCLHDAPKNEIKHTPLDNQIYDITKELLKSYGLQNTLTVFEAEWGKASLSNPNIQIAKLINNQERPLDTKITESTQPKAVEPPQAHAEQKETPKENLGKSLESVAPNSILGINIQGSKAESVEKPKSDVPKDASLAQSQPSAKEQKSLNAADQHQSKEEVKTQE